MTRNPLVTVILPVYNHEQYVAEAIKSILRQTYQNLKLVIIDDGSDDSSLKIIKSFKNKKINILVNKGNRGLVYSLNLGFAMAAGKYIARMDADDISLPERLEEQVSFMEENSEIAVCGTWIKTLYNSGEYKLKEYPTEPERIKCEMLFGAVMAHPSVILRRDAVQKGNFRYNKEMTEAEDYELWMRMLKDYKFANIPKYLFIHRAHEDNKSLLSPQDVDNSVKATMRKFLTSQGLQPTEEELTIHFSLGGSVFYGKQNSCQKAFNWLNRLKTYNNKSPLFSKEVFAAVLAEKRIMVQKRELPDLYYEGRYKLAPRFIDMGKSFFRYLLNTNNLAPLSPKKYSDPAVFTPGLKFEVDNQIVSDFVVRTLYPMVGLSPYPVSELLLITSAVCYVKPDYIFEWGTHLGKSARIFYEIKKGFDLNMEIHTFDLPDNTFHSEHPKNNYALFIRGIAEIYCHRGDGLTEALKIVNHIGKNKKMLFYLDGDHQYPSVKRELDTIFEWVPRASMIIHDTFFIGERSICNNGAYRAVKDFLQEHKGKYYSIEMKTGRPGLTFLLHV